MHAALAKKSSPKFWGAKSFQNQAALSWLEDLENADGLDYVEETLDELLDAEASGDLPDTDTAARAVAAAETVAALVEKPGDALPEEVRQWCFDNPGFDLSEVQPKALQALGVILTELRLEECFEDSTDADRWEIGLEELLDRLR